MPAAPPSGGAPGMPGGQGIPGAPGMPGGQAAAGAQSGMPAGAGQTGQARPRFVQLTLNDYRIRDVWEHKDLTLKETSMYVDMLPHSVKVYRFIRK